MLTELLKLFVFSVTVAITRSKYLYFIMGKSLAELLRNMKPLTVLILKGSNKNKAHVRFKVPGVLEGQEDMELKILESNVPLKAPGVGRGMTSYHITSKEEQVWSETRAKHSTTAPLLDCEQRFSAFKEEG